MKLPLALSIALNCVLLTALVAVAVRYKLFDKAQRVFLEEGRVPLVKRSYELNRNYNAFREIFAHYQDEERPILVLGDSHTAKLDWNAFLGRGDIAVRGIDGDTSEGLLNRIGDLDCHSAERVVIWIGTNDILTGIRPGKLVANVKSSVQLLRQKGSAEIVVCAVMPFASWMDYAESLNAKVAEANSALEALSHKERVRFVDLFSAVCDANGYISESKTSDGFHLNRAGYEAVTDLLFGDVQSAQGKD